MSALRSLQRILPLQGSIQQPSEDINEEPTTEQPSISQPKLDQLIEYVSKFETYDAKLTEYHKKLEPVGIILSDFNQELAQLSSSLISLEQQSTKLSKDSKLQTIITEKLNPVILDLMIPPDIVNCILKEPVDVKFVTNLKFIIEKKQLLENIKSGEQQSKYQNSTSLTQLEKGVTLLESKAVERIRDFIITQIRMLRLSSKSSSQLIQQRLLDVKEAFAFLTSQHKQLAQQLRLAYVYTMKWYYQSKFAKYLYSLQKSRLRLIDISIVLGYSDENHGMFGTSSWTSWMPSATTTSQTPTVPTGQTQVSIGEYLLLFEKRIEILKSKSKSAIPSQIAETSPFPNWSEFLYDQFLMAIMDNIIVEYLFMVEFFYQGNENFSKEGTGDKKIWSEIMFSNVFELGKEFLNWLMISNTSVLDPINYDALGILLTIKLIQEAQTKLHNEYHIPVLDEYLNSCLLMLWPLFTKVIDSNCESMKKSILRTKKITNLGPLNITQHFAQFLSALLRLTQDNQGEPLYTCVTRLCHDFESCLTKCSTILGKKPTEKEIFLYNNYFLIVNILTNENVESDDFIQQQIQHFQLLVDAYKQD
ncbi:Vacuolar protein sorting-associated protein 52 [Spathaspora sp. JA1]|nr:Vacuolar protein sorting-associated protein 52 [Spathaspora sp. JA1]